jgi:hypothetical protein
MDMTEDPFKGPDQTVIHVGGREVVLTLEDARRLKTALMDHLKRSKVEDRDYLVRMTDKVPGWIDPDGRVRIGGWLLQARGDSLALTYRMPGGPGAIKAYTTRVTKEAEGWKLSDVSYERIAPRR